MANLSQKNVKSAMILAAGRGERMRPLTDRVPKPLLMVGDKPLVEHHILRLINAGFDHIVLNTAHLGEQIEACLGDGSRFGIDIDYSREGQGQALETDGGIYKALDLLRGEVFAVINGDVWSDFDLGRLNLNPLFNQKALAAHLVMVKNPEHNTAGDFCLVKGRVAVDGCNERLTFSGMSLFHRDFFKKAKGGAFPLAPMLRDAMGQKQVSGELHDGLWVDVGTPERLEMVNNMLEAN